jgi:hypothetical protein
MATTNTGTPSTNEPIENQAGADVAAGGGLPEDGQDMGATVGAGGTAGGEGAQEAAAAALREEEARIRVDLETTRPTRNPEDIAARQEKLRSIRERITTKEEEKKTDQQDWIVSLGKQLASLAAQPLMRWLYTVPAEMQQDQPKGHSARQQQELEEPSPPYVDWSRTIKPTEVQLAATETLAPAEARMEPTEVQLAATESLTPAEGSKQPQECSRRTQQYQQHSRDQPSGYGKRQQQEPAEPEEPGELEELKEPEEDPGWDEWPPDGNSRPLPSHEDRSRRCGAENTAEKDAVTAFLEEEAREYCKPEPRRIVLTPENIAARGKSTRAIHAKQAVVGEPRRMRRAREGGTAAEADTVGVRREAVRFAEDAKMDPSNCLIETLVLRENQEGIRIRRSPGGYTEHLPWVLERVFLQTLCGPGNDEQG